MWKNKTYQTQLVLRKAESRWMTYEEISIKIQNKEF
jgi:hypothetical protein